MALREAEHLGSHTRFVQLPNNFGHKNQTESVFFARFERCDSCLNSLAISRATLNQTIADSVRSGTFPCFRAHGDAVLRTGTFRHRCPSSFNPLQGPR